MRRTVSLVLCCLAVQAAADEPEEVPPPRGIFVGEDLRFQHTPLITGVVERSFMDLIAIPSGITGWDANDWGTLALITGATLGLSTSPGGPSLDVRIQQAIGRGSRGGTSLLWTPVSGAAVWIGVWAFNVALLGVGLLAPDPAVVETVALMVEAFAVGQLYHLGLKLLLGRQGPTDGPGRYDGPAGALRYFPNGSPSGHAASIWALISVVVTYWNQPLLDVALIAAGLALSVTLITDDYHYTSEVVLGAAIGTLVGRWVVHRRSSRFRSGGEPALLDRLVIAPQVGPGVFGLSAGASF